MPTCQGTNRDGTPCKRKVREDQKYCWQHSPALKRVSWGAVGGLLLTLLAVLAYLSEILAFLHGLREPTLFPLTPQVRPTSVVQTARPVTPISTLPPTLIFYFTPKPSFLPAPVPTAPEATTPTLTATATYTPSEGQIIPIGFPTVQRRVPSSALAQLDWSPDGKHIALGWTGERLVQMLTVFDTNSLEEVAELLREPYPPYLRSVVYSQNGQWLAVGDEAGTIRVFSCGDYTQLRALVASRTPNFDATVTKITFSSDSRLLLASTQEGQLIAWDTTDWHEVFRVKAASDRNLRFDVTSDGHTISATNGDIVDIWNVATASKEGSFLSYHILPIQNIEFLDEQTLMTVAWDKISTWDVSTGKEQSRIEGSGEYRQMAGFPMLSKTFFQGYEEAISATWSADLRYAVIQDRNNSDRLVGLLLQKSDTGNLISIIQGTYGDYLQLVLSPDGTRLAGTTEDVSYNKNSALHIWDIGNN